MAKKIRERIIFRSVTRVWTVDTDGNRVKGFIPEETMPASYIKYDEKTGQPEQVVYHKIKEMVGTRVQPKAETVLFTNGHKEIRPGEEALLRFLESHPNLDTLENREKGNKILFERVNLTKEKVAEVSTSDMIVTAFNLIASTSPKDLVIYGKSLGLDTSDVEEVVKDGMKEKEVAAFLKKDEWLSFIVDMKTHAQSSTESFIRGLSNPLNKALSVIAEATAEGVITFDSKGYQYGWKAGNDMLPIKQLPQGVDKEKWFAQWLFENSSTLQEMENRISLAKAASQ